MWLNTTHMHLFTHTKPESLGQAGRWQSPYHDTMIDHDKNVGQMLDLLDELGIADDTFVHVLDRQRPAQEHLAGRRHDAVPQREEHQLGRRLPRSAAGALAGQDRGRARSPTASSSTTTGCRPSSPWPARPTSSRSSRRATRPIGRTYKNHIDGFNLLPYLTGKAKESPRKLFFYFSDDGDVLGMRYDNWKIVFMEQRCQGTLQVWAEPFTRLRLPKIFNLRTDPYEFADITSNTYYDWFLHNAYFIYAAQTAAAKFAETFKDFPPVQKPSSFTIDDAMAKMAELTANRRWRRSVEAAMPTLRRWPSPLERRRGESRRSSISSRA